MSIELNIEQTEESADRILENYLLMIKILDIHLKDKHVKMVGCDLYY